MISDEKKLTLFHERVSKGFEKLLSQKISKTSKLKEIDAEPMQKKTAEDFTVYSIDTLFFYVILEIPFCTISMILCFFTVACT